MIKTSLVNSQHYIREEWAAKNSLDTGTFPLYSLSTVRGHQNKLWQKRMINTPRSSREVKGGGRKEAKIDKFNSNDQKKTQTTDCEKDGATNTRWRKGRCEMYLFQVCKQNRTEDRPRRNRFGFVKTQTQSTELTGEMQEDPNQDTTHRVGNLSVSESSQDSNGDFM